MNTITIKDATGNIICSVESSPITTSPIDDGIKDLSKCSTECTKAVESLNALVTTYKVCSTEGFGDTAKMVAGKMQEKIKFAIEKLIEFFKKIGEFIRTKIFAKVRDLIAKIKSKSNENSTEKKPKNKDFIPYYIDSNKLENFKNIVIYDDSRFNPYMENVTRAINLVGSFLNKPTVAEATNLSSSLQDLNFVSYFTTSVSTDTIKEVLVKLYNNPSILSIKISKLANALQTLSKYSDVIAGKLNELKSAETGSEETNSIVSTYNSIEKCFNQLTRDITNMVSIANRLILTDFGAVTTRWGEN